MSKMNKFIITDDEEILSDDILIKIASVLQKYYKIEDVWEEYNDSEKGISFENMCLTYKYGYGEKVIFLEINHEAMSIDKQVELFKMCYEAVLERKDIV